MLSNKIVKKQTVGRKIARMIMRINDELMGLIVILAVIALILTVVIPDFLT